VKIVPANITAPLLGDKQDAANKTNREPNQGRAREDQLDISSRGRRLQENYKATLKSPIEDKNNSEKKLDLIRLKIRKRYYDKPQIKMKIADKLTADKTILRQYYKSVF